MGTWQAPQVTNDMGIEDLRNLVAVLIKDMDYLLNGYLDSKNLKVNGIETKNLKAGAVTAEKIDVNELSAISANLGHIIAGLIESVTITGSLIQTAEPGIYPRIEFSATEDLLKAFTSATQTMSIIATWLGFPVIRMEDGTTNAMMYLYKDTLTSRLMVESSTNIRIVSNVGDIDLATSGAGAAKYNGTQIAKVNEAGNSLFYNNTSKVLTLFAADGTLLSTANLS